MSYEVQLETDEEIRLFVLLRAEEAATRRAEAENTFLKLQLQQLEAEKAQMQMERDFYVRLSVSLDDERDLSIQDGSLQRYSPLEGHISDIRELRPHNTDLAVETHSIIPLSCAS
ncbi:hypothetical protein GF380_04330 [Candidatus Uhrbacteria bacterium]|nr:hypothetical protein [Candidatus Uhrbacteria bacterium]MBD3284293.1 hypothetical protein [Candidatus Uhrbacteria bacterium]